MGCGLSKDEQQAREQERREHIRDDHHGHHGHKSSKKKQKSPRPVNQVRYDCQRRHRGCRGVILQSHNIPMQDGTYMNFTWQPCRLPEVQEYIMDNASNPEDANLLSNKGSSEPQQRRRSARQSQQPVPPEQAYNMAGAAGDFDDMEPGPFGRPVPRPVSALGQDDMMYGRGASARPVSPLSGDDDMVYDVPGPDHGYGGEEIEMERGPFGRNRRVPAPMSPGEDDMAYGSPAPQPQGTGYQRPSVEDYVEGEDTVYATASTGARSGGSWAGSTVAPASRPPRARYVANREENLYQGGDTDTYYGLPGVAISQERSSAPRTADWDELRYSQV